MAAPFMKGKGAFLVLFIGGTKSPPLNVKSWNLKKVVEQIADGVNGENEDRLDVELKHYALSMECFNDTASNLITLVEYDISLSNEEQKQVVFGLTLRDGQGASNGFTLKRAVIDDWTWASGGRTDRMMLTIPIRGNSFSRLA